MKRNLLKKPTTAYQLLGQVCEAIALAPGNYYQEDYAIDPKYIGAGNAEACGTAFCRAGWMCALMEDDKARTPDEWDRMDLDGPPTQLLLDAGISGEEISDLFGGGACGTARYGTKAYIKAGVKGVKDFMKKHEAALKATKLKGRVWRDE